MTGKYRQIAAWACWYLLALPLAAAVYVFLFVYVAIVGGILTGIDRVIEIAQERAR